MYDSEKDYKKDDKKVLLKLPEIKTSSAKIDYEDKRFTRSDSFFDKAQKPNKEVKSLSRLSMKSNSNSNGRFSSQSHYQRKSKSKSGSSNEQNKNEKFSKIEKIDESLNLSNENKITNAQSLET